MIEKKVFSATENICDNIRNIVRNSDTDELIKKYVNDTSLYYEIENYIRKKYTETEKEKNNLIKNTINVLSYNINVLKIKTVLIKDTAVKTVFTIDLFLNEKNSTKVEKVFVCITVSLKEIIINTDIEIVSSDKKDKIIKDIKNFY